MLSAAPPKPFFSGSLVLQRRLPSSTSWAGKTFFSSPISCSVAPSDFSDGDDRTDGGAPMSKVGSGGGVLRGSDILLAMQRSVARKEGSAGGGGHRNGRKGKKRRASKGGDGIDRPLPADYDYGSVRPIEIRDDWGPRIDELRRRIQELRSRYHF